LNGFRREKKKKRKKRQCAVHLHSDCGQLRGWGSGFDPQAGSPHVGTRSAFGVVAGKSKKWVRIESNTF
jgi:hypothetical protein